MNYNDYRKAYRTWLIGLILFSIAGIWYVYRIIIDKDLNSVIFLFVFIMIMVVNYSRIKIMKEKVENAKKEYKEKIVDNL